MRDIASAADELSASVNEIDRQVAQSNAIPTKAVNEVESTNLAVKELDEAAARIGDVVKLITDIAEQTNLLALNATIEAARAGEAGRGFAVVAGEVKELANQSGQSAEEIARKIESVQASTREAVKVIESIVQFIGQLNVAAARISDAVEGQTRTTNQILAEAASARKGVEEIARSIAEVAKGATDVSGNTSEVSKAATDVSRNASEAAEAAPGEGARRAGEDVAVGRPVVIPGRVVTGLDLMLARSAGLDRIAVRRPQVRVIDVSSATAPGVTANVTRAA